MLPNRLPSLFIVVSILIATSLFALPAIRAQEYVNPNLIVDGMTEAENMNAWRLYGAAGTFTAEKFITDPACIEGGDGACQARVIHLRTTGTTGGIQQLNIPVQRGKTYQFFFKYRLLSGSLATRFGIHSSNGDFANMSEKISKVTPGESYWDYTRSVTIPNDFNGDFRLVFVLQNGEAYIDEVNLWDVENVMNSDYMAYYYYSDDSFLMRDPFMDMNGTVHWQPWGAPRTLEKNASGLHLNTIGTGGGAQQLNIPVKAGGKYKLKFSYQVLSGVLRPIVGIGTSNSDFQGVYVNLGPSNDLRNYERTIDIPQNFVRDFRLVFILRNGEAYIDNVVLEDLTVVMRTGTLTVSRDVVTNIKASQIVAGTTNVTFGAYKLQTGNVEDVKIKKITVRNIGSNTNGVVSIGVYDGATLVGHITKATFGSDINVLGNDPKSVTFDYGADPYVITKNTYKVLTVKANTVYSATSGQTVQLVIDSIDAEGVGSAARIYPNYTSETASVAATNAWTVGTPVIASAGNGSSTRFAAPVMTAVATGGSMDGMSTMVTGWDLVTGDTNTTYRVTKMNPVMFGSSIYGEAASVASTYSYAVGDVVMLTDAGTTTDCDFQVVGANFAAGANMTNANALINGMTLTATNDRIVRVAAGFSETTLAMAETTIYNTGDIVAYASSTNVNLNGLQVMNNGVAVGDSLLPAIHAGYGTTSAVVAGDRVTKMPTLHTELASATAAYSYAVGDVIVISSATEYSNNGTYVVENAVAAGGSILGNGLGTGISLTTSDRISKLDVTGQEDSLKRLYPTKLNFAWGLPAFSTLTTGNQVEIARFIMGADASNVNNPDAEVEVSALNFANLSTAGLMNLTLKDYSLNENVARGANSTSFDNSAAGGLMSEITLQQGETRTFLILADVCTYDRFQVAQLKFNAGNQFTTTGSSTATWNVTWGNLPAGQSAQTSYWTVLSGDASDTSSTTLTGPASASCQR